VTQRVVIKAYSAGDCTAAANAPDDFAAVVKSTLQGCIRSAPYVDKEEMARRLIDRGIAADVAHMIAQTAEIIEDEAYFSDDWPR
jgi:hypothetical protein